MKTPLTDCRKCIEGASDFLSGESTPLARFVTRVHLRFCSDCRVLVDQLATTIAVLRFAGRGRDGMAEQRKKALLAALRQRPRP